MTQQVTTKAKRFLTVKDVAEELSMGLASVYRVIKSGQLKITRLTGDTIRIERKDLEEYIAACKE